MQLSLDLGLIRNVFQPAMRAGYKHGVISVVGRVRLEGGSAYYRVIHRLPAQVGIFYVEKFDRERSDFGAVASVPGVGVLDADAYHLVVSIDGAPPKALASFQSYGAANRACSRLFDVSRGRNLPRLVRYSAYAVVAYLLVGLLPLASGGPRNGAQLRKQVERQQLNLPDGVGSANVRTVPTPSPEAIFGAAPQAPKAAPEAGSPPNEQQQGSFFDDQPKQ